MNHPEHHHEFTKADLRMLDDKTRQRDKTRGYDLENCKHRGKDKAHLIVEKPYTKHYPWIYVKLEDHSFRFALRPPDGLNLPGQRRVETIPHSMLARGQPVIGAGECETDETGQIVRINNFSGHYQPGEKNLRETKSNMEQQGLSIKSATWELFNEHGQVIKRL